MRLYGRRVASTLLLPFLASLLRPPGAAIAAGGDGRITAQSIGLTDSTSSAIPGLVWGGNRRCDPTDPACSQGGKRDDDFAELDAQPLPAKPFAISEMVSLQLTLSGQPLGTIELGLWREQAPASVDAFVQLAAGTLAPLRGDEPASLARASLVRVSRDREVVLGALRQVRPSVGCYPPRRTHGSSPCV